MIECVTWATEHRFQGHPITKQFELRFQNSILMEKWKHVHVNFSEATGRYEECDSYDTRYSEYLIKRDNRGNVLGTIRTGPTTVPYMLKDHFSDLVKPDFRLPCSPNHHELSRLAVNRSLLQPALSKMVTRELLLAAQERGLQRGINAYWGIVVEEVAEKVFSEAGYEVQFLGNPFIDPETEAKIFGVKLAVNEAVYQRCQRKSGIYNPVLNFGQSEGGRTNPILTHRSPELSKDFIQSEQFDLERKKVFPNGVSKRSKKP